MLAYEPVRLQNNEKFKNISELLKEIFTLCGCDINIHGHTHSYTVSDKRCINACLEVNDFKPVEITDIL